MIRLRIREDGFLSRIMSPQWPAGGVARKTGTVWAARAAQYTVE